MKIEIGSGNAPQPGYLHLDVSADFPEIDFVCDLTKDKIPLDDSVVDEVLANHVVEHIPWRLIPIVFAEISRVLKPGGQFLIRTPDLKFIARNYLMRQTTEEYPEDIKALESVFGSYGAYECALVKLFSGQDYPSNFHFNCFDEDSLKRALMRNGFTFATRTNLGREFSPGELQFRGIK